MNRHVIITALAAVAVLGLLIGLALRSQHTLEAGLPPRIECRSEAHAHALAQTSAQLIGAQVFRVLGTGSMQPYIPAAPAGRNPLETATAFAVTKPGATFEDVTPGALCLYRHNSSAVGVTIHGAALRTRFGWIMSGLNNARSDATMTRETFIGIVADVFVWPL